MKDWPKGNDIVTITLSHGLDRKTIKYCEISPPRSIGIEGWLARASWIEGIRKGNRKTINPHLHAGSRYNFDIIEAMTEKDTGGHPEYYWPRSLPEAHGTWKDRRKKIKLEHHWQKLLSRFSEFCDPLAVAVSFCIKYLAQSVRKSLFYGLHVHSKWLWVGCF